MKFFLLTVLTVLGLQSLSARADWWGGGFKVPDWNPNYSRLPEKPSCTVEVKKTIKLRKGQVLDGKGCLYTWRGAGYPKKCHASGEVSESEPRMFVMAPGSTIKNLQMECSLDGILMASNTTVQNIVNRDCEEDCITTGGKGNRIIDNKFFFCQDKCIQMNGASNVQILRNQFFEALRPISGSGKTSGAATGIVAESNECKNCEIMIRAQNKHDVTAKNNRMEGGECLFETVESAVIYDRGGNVATGGATLLCKDGTGNIKR